MPTELLVIGAGGHAKVVIEAIQENSQARCIILADQDKTKVGQKVLGKLAIQNLNSWAKLPMQCHVAIGDNRIRQQLNIEAMEQGKQPLTVMHTNASVSPSACLGSGSFVAAKVVISAEAKIEEGCIINHGSIVDHDCRIGAYSHIAPNATLGGGVDVGRRCLIGAGAVLLPGIKLGDDVTVGAGSVVVKDISSGEVVYGVPAKCLNG